MPAQPFSALWYPACFSTVFSFHSLYPFLYSPALKFFAPSVPRPANSSARPHVPSSCASPANLADRYVHVRRFVRLVTVKIKPIGPGSEYGRHARFIVQSRGADSSHARIPPGVFYADHRDRESKGGRTPAGLEGALFPFAKHDIRAL